MHYPISTICQMKYKIKYIKEQYFLMKFWHITFRKWLWKFAAEILKIFVNMVNDTLFVLIFAKNEDNPHLNMLNSMETVIFKY